MAMASEFQIQKTAKQHGYRLTVLPRRVADYVVYDILLVKDERTVLADIDTDRYQAFWKAGMALRRDGIAI